MFLSFKKIPFTPVCILDIEKGNYNTSPINGICFAKDGITYYLPYFLAKNDADFISYMEDENIKKMRLALGISQVELAKRLGVTKQCVSNWENDNILPSLDMLKKIAKYLQE